MSRQVESLDIADRRLCSDCIDETFLSAKVAKEGQDGVCFYCEREGRTFSIGKMADEIEAALEEHFYHTPEEPSEMECVMIKEGDYDWEREGDPVADVIGWNAELAEESAEDIRLVLSERHCDGEREQMWEEGPFDQEAHYAGKRVDYGESQASWFHFEQSLKTQARYFNQAVEDILTPIFAGLGEQTTREGQSIIVEAGPETQLTRIYRARVFQSDEKLKEALIRPDKEVGTPPPWAAISGRMNAHGIAVFYGATDPLTALSEVRPPVGSKVVVGSFELIRPVRLLDVEALRSLNVEGSIFDREYLRRKERARFLEWLSHRLTMPVMPEDEPFDYLPTQVIADFLAAEAEPPLDGILYPSVQGSENHLNIVLFHKAACVQELDIPKGTKISASLHWSTEEGLETNYWVSEEVSPEESPTPPANAIRWLQPTFMDEPAHEEYDPRGATLRLDTSTLQVHHIKSVTFETEPHTVFRHRSEKRERGF